MNVSTLVFLVLLFWLSYPLFGGIGVAVRVKRGTRPKDAGFSFLPELIVFPPLFLLVAFFIDCFAAPWGRWIVGMISLILFLYGVGVSIAGLIELKRDEPPLNAG